MWLPDNLKMPLLINPGEQQSAAVKRKTGNSFTLSAFKLAPLGLVTGSAADPVPEKEAKPSLGERITEGTIQGTLMKIEGEYYWVKDNVGRDIRLRVDQSTKLDKVAVGDKIKAYIYFTDEFHITTLQRVDD